MIHLIVEKVTPLQLQGMREVYDLYIKLAVDIEQEILTGGGIMHADCEKVLLENGSQQENIWGAGYYPVDKRVDYTSLINIRPRQNNPGQEVVNDERRKKIEEIVRKRLDP